MRRTGGSCSAPPTREDTGMLASLVRRPRLPGGAPLPGADSPADVYITTDLANLWRAEQAGLLQGVTSPTLRAQIPDSRRDAAGNWWALSTRLRVPVVSTERVPAGTVTS